MTEANDAPRAAGQEGGPAEVIIEDGRWQAVEIERLAERAISAGLAQLGLAPERFLVSILAADDAAIARLNRDFRGKDRPTNVLSWPSVERRPAVPGQAPPLPGAGEEELGDIALAYETCTREAREAGISLQDHVTHLLVHGLLHLLGYDHERDADATLMEMQEVAILAGLGIANPYRWQEEADRPAEQGGNGQRSAQDGKD
ncbi:probable rRNA maturation factor [Meinhardsimonia xiamenensis]|uniref:Endoribonuclease YbeY n=1 Tax=Meinhardsimonia xiamenensis TaxID=990712 RepID=A0A1G9CDW0_9RHOB|nr:rRNA maturation RNase YbeY [Meinhardsimonia xiamenensis]PRX38395.1 putative rRNA maturation factor [Meinhardsimonia xiamenensis]SDK49851.1 probable rRNA maturation factor [Meinhardsimonia xiamenensis]